MEAIMTKNGGVQALVVKEKKSLVKKMWDGIVDTKVKINQVLIKGVPIGCVVTSIFAPEAAIALVPIALFFTTKTGKNLLNFAIRNEELSGELWKGNVTEVNEQIKEDTDKFLNQDIDVQGMIDDVSTISGGVSRDR